MADGAPGSQQSGFVKQSESSGKNEELESPGIMERSEDNLLHSSHFKDLEKEDRDLEKQIDEKLNSEIKDVEMKCREGLKKNLSTLYNPPRFRPKTRKRALLKVALYRKWLKYTLLKLLKDETEQRLWEKEEKINHLKTSLNDSLKFQEDQNRIDEDKRKTIDSLRKQQNQLRNEIRVLNSKLEHMEKEMSLMNERLQSAEMEKSDMNSKLKLEMEKVADLESTLERMKNDTSKEKKLAQETASITKSLKKDLDDKNKEWNQVMEKNSELKKVIEYHEKTISQLNNELCIRKMEASSLDHSLSTTKAELENQTRKQRIILSKLNQIHFNSKSIELSSEGSIDPEKEEDRALKNVLMNIESTDKEIANLMDSNSMLKDNVEKEKEKIAQIMNEKNKMEFDLKETINKLTSAFEKNEELEIVLQEEKSRFSELEVVKKNIERELKDTNDAFFSLKKEEEELKTELEKMNFEKKQSILQLEKVKNERDEMRIKFDLEKFQLESNVRELQRVCDEFALNKKDWQKKWEEVEKRCNQIEIDFIQEKSQLLLKIKEMENESVKCSLEMNKAKQEHLAEVDEMRILKSEMDSLKNTLTESYNARSKVGKFANEMNEKLSAMVEGNLKLNSKLNETESLRMSKDQAISSDLKEMKAALLRKSILDKDIMGMRSSQMKTEEEGKKLHEMYNECMKQNSSLEAKIKHLEKSNSFFKSEFERVKNEKIKVEDITQGIGIELNSALEDNIKLQKELELAESNFNQQFNSSRIKELELETIKISLTQQSNSIQCKERQLQDLMQLMNQKESQLACLSDLITQVEEEMRVKVEELQHTRDEWKGLQEFSGRVTNMNSGEIQNNFGGGNSPFLASNASTGQLSEKIDESQSKLDSLKCKVKGIEEHLNTLISILSKLEEEKKSIERESWTKDEAIRKLVSEKDEFEACLTEKLEVMAEMEKMMKATEEKRDQLSRALEEARRVLSYGFHQMNMMSNIQEWIEGYKENHFMDNKDSLATI